jgi:hypothetical protein
VNRDIFINCPFDDDYRPLFQALVFVVADCGFRARCALELLDSGETRCEKLRRLIRESRYGIHDISRTETDKDSGLPRFNMPFELGLDVGCKFFGGQSRERSKRILVLSKERYEYQKYLSDIAGQDIQAHQGRAEDLIDVVRGWLQQDGDGGTLPGAAVIKKRYTQFQDDLPYILAELHLGDEDLKNFHDYHNSVSEWLRINESPRVKGRRKID